MHRTPPQGLWSDEDGASTSLAFAISFPFVILVTGLVLQHGMMAWAYLVVKQAAYWGARAAVVHVADGRHSTGGHLDRQKIRKIETAVHVALMPACLDIDVMGGAVRGRAAGNRPGSLGMLSGIGKVAGRLAFAKTFSAVEVRGDARTTQFEMYGRVFTPEERGGEWISGPGDYGRSENLLVRVTFHYPLKIPFARRLIGGHIRTLWPWAPAPNLYRRGEVGDAFDALVGMGGGNQTNEYYARMQAQWHSFNEQRVASFRSTRSSAAGALAALAGDEPVAAGVLASVEAFARAALASARGRIDGHAASWEDRLATVQERARALTSQVTAITTSLDQIEQAMARERRPAVLSQLQAQLQQGHTELRTAQDELYRVRFESAVDSEQATTGRDARQAIDGQPPPVKEADPASGRGVL